jgi:gas vesicle protein
MKKKPEKKIKEKSDDLKKTVSGKIDEVKNDAVRLDRKASAAVSETDRKAGKAGNEMKASLQQMKKDIKEFPKKADKKNRK